MTGNLNIAEFVKDYCAGITDTALRAKYGLNAVELLQLVKQLVSEGTVTRAQYRERRQKIEELHSGEEKDFLKSLYVCPVCSHMHPTRFIRCPACGHDSSKHKDKKAHGGALHQKPEEESSRDESDAGDGAGGPGPSSIAVRASSQESVKAVAFASEVSEEKPSVLRAVPTDSAPEHAPETIRNMIGLPLANLSFLLAHDAGASGERYRITELVDNDARSAVFKAEGSSKRSPAMRAKLFHHEPADGAGISEVVEEVFLVQSNMEDPNILRIIGKATLDGKPILLYEHMPFSMQLLLREQPNGLPIDLLIHALAQILNGVGYMHMHRGKDGVTRRLPHMNLKPSNILIDETMQVIKIDECGVSKSLAEVRGHKRHVWEEPATELALLCPEAFVMESRSVNGIQADIYALGILLYQMATGKAPFTGSNLDEYRFAHMRTYPVPPKVHRFELPLWLDEMILKCLEKEPNNRWRSATQMELAMGKRLTKWRPDQA